MRSRLALAALLLLLPVPALADVTARYRLSEGTVTVEVADNGDSRLEIDAKLKLAIIGHAGIDYVVMRGFGGTERVARADAMMAAIATPSPGQPPDAPMHFVATRGAADSVAGFSGFVWSLGPRSEPPLDFLISPDPRLAPVGTVFRRLIDIILAALGPAQVDPAVVRPIFAEGAPIRMTSPPGSSEERLMVTLDSFETGPVDPARFAVTGPVLSAAAFRAALSPPPPPPARGVIID